MHSGSSNLRTYCMNVYCMHAEICRENRKGKKARLKKKLAKTIKCEMTMYPAVTKQKNMIWNILSRKKVDITKQISNRPKPIKPKNENKKSIKKLE